MHSENLSQSESPTTIVQEFVPQSHEEDVSQSHPMACLFVANLLAALSDAHLHASISRHFQDFGPIENVKVLRDSYGRPYAFLQFQNAMNALQGSLLDSRNIRVEQARVNRSLYVKFPQPITEDELMEVILAYGEVEETKLEYGQQPSDVQGENDENDENVNVQDKRAGKSNESLLSSTKAAMTKKEKQSEADKETDSDVPIIGKQNTGKHPKAEPKPLIVSATVKFCYRQCATTAFWSLRDDGHWIVEWSDYKVPTKGKTTIYIGGLCSTLPEKKVVEKFQTFGSINSSKMLAREDGSAYAFIDYSDSDAAAKAVMQMHGMCWLGMALNVHVREQRKRHSNQSLRPRTSSWDNWELFNAQLQAMYQPYQYPGVYGGYYPAVYYDPSLVAPIAQEVYVVNDAGQE